MKNSTCVILVPANFGVEPACEKSMQELERREYPVWRVRGFASIDQGRSQMASDSLAQRFDDLFWLDADTESPQRKMRCDSTGRGRRDEDFRREVRLGGSRKGSGVFCDWPLKRQ